MQSVALTDRQRNELEYYEQYSTMSEPVEVNFKPVTTDERRPWNSYWNFIELVQDHLRGDMKLLDFGCGTGEYSMIFAKAGYDVVGFDISPNNVALAKDYAAKYGLEDKCDFVVSVAETLDFPDEHFDVITGINILHHVDIKNSLRECMRVLKPGGIALFHEPVRAPLFDIVRESRLGTMLVSKEASFDRHITEDERKLSHEDFAIIKSFDAGATFVRFLLFARLDRFIPSGNRKVSFLEQFDAWLFRMLPFTRRFAGECIITLHK